MTKAALNKSRHICDAGHEYRISLPNWGKWLDLLDQIPAQIPAQMADANMNPDLVGRMLPAWLHASVQCRKIGQTPYSRVVDFNSLPAALVDQLSQQGIELLEEETATLNIEVTSDNDMIEVGWKGGRYRLDPLSFAQRNACLRAHLGVADGEVFLDASGYELALVASSISNSHSDVLPDIPALRKLPIAVGEALVKAARQLSDPATQQELAGFQAAGLEHPDIALAELCLAFGISPKEAEEMPAKQAGNMRLAARLLIAANNAVAYMPDSADLLSDAHPDAVTKIVVNDE